MLAILSKAKVLAYGCDKVYLCNVWRGDTSAFIVELAVEDWEALGKLRDP